MCRAFGNSTRQDKEERTERNNVPTPPTIKKGGKVKFNFQGLLTLTLTIIVLFLFNFGCTMDNSQKASKKQGGYGASVISYFNNRILYVYRWGTIMKGDYTVLVDYDYSTNKYHILGKSEAFYESPTYSQDGRKITYALVKDGSSNICIMNADGSNVEQLTNDYNDDAKVIDTPTGNVKKIKFNTKPSFSPDGKKIIFQRASMRRKHVTSGRNMLTSWDVCELDIKTKAVKKLTDYQFYEMSRPFYLSDSKRFIFSATGPIIDDKDFNENYRKQYQYNHIFIMDGVNNELKPAFLHGIWTSEPFVAKDDTILFLSITNEMDGLPPKPENYDLFLKKGGTIKRITKDQGYRFIMQPSISFDEKRISFLAAKHADKESSGYIINSDGTGLTKIVLPGIDNTEQ